MSDGSTPEHVQCVRSTQRTCPLPVLPVKTLSPVSRLSRFSSSTTVSKTLVFSAGKPFVTLLLGEEIGDEPRSDPVHPRVMKKCQFRKGPVGVGAVRPDPTPVSSPGNRPSFDTRWGSLARVKGRNTKYPDLSGLSPDGSHSLLRTCKATSPRLSGHEV